MKEIVNTYTFPSGLRLIHILSTAPVAYCGISIDAGTRDELSTEQGMAHFCEHMMFKGTEKRKAWHIINRMESVGGDLNAYTNKEETVVYSAFMKENLSRAVELLFDVVYSSTYPQAEIDKEREVIVDEIESYNDSPADLIFDHFENLIYEGHDLGHDILGQAENIRRFQTTDAKAFTQRLYKPEKMVFFVLGDYDFAIVKNTVEKYAPKMALSISAKAKGETIRKWKSKQNGRFIIEDRGTHQAHVMLGVQTFSYDDPRRMPLFLLNNMLGGPGMNARLNLSLRERNGLVYTVESTQASYSDTGCWSVYFGCDHHDVKRCLRLVHRELDRLMQHPLSERLLQAAKRQLKGQLAIACDNREQFALDFAKHFLHYGHERSIAELLLRIDAITSTQIQDVAQQLFAPEKLQLLML